MSEVAVDEHIAPWSGAWERGGNGRRKENLLVVA